MGRSPCCDKVGLKKGPWTPEEDQKLLAYIEDHGHGSWRALPAKAGLQRCGKSCRLRWTNYLRPDIKRGKFSIQEEQTIIQLHALLGNRWSAIATHLPKRTDNEIKNYWNTHVKKRLGKMGIDPVTNKPQSDAILSTDGHSKNAANLSHMAQWESARLEAEARLVRQSKLRPANSFQGQNLHASTELSTSPSSPLNKTGVAPPAGPPRCLDILKAWNGCVWAKQSEPGGSGQGGGDLDSPTSTLSYSENNAPQLSSAGARMGDGSAAFIEQVGNHSSGSCDGGGIMIEEGEEDWKGFGNYKDGIEHSVSFTSVALQDMSHMTMHVDGGAATWTRDSLRPDNPDEADDHHVRGGGNFVGTFTDLLLNNAGDRSFSEGCGESDNGGVTVAAGGGPGSEYLEDNKIYWNSILNLVNSSPSDSPMF